MHNYTRPDGSFLSHTVITNSSGGYSETYQPDEIGQWYVTASWNGNSSHMGTESNTMSFYVSFVIPEFSPIMIPTLLMLVTLVVVILVKTRARLLLGV